MIPLRLSALLAVFALSACMAPEPATRAAHDPSQLAPAAASGARMAQQWNVRAIDVQVPKRLHVSEANLFFPLADIVWRGDARGDRYAQVDAIVTEAAKRATKDMRKGTPVTVEITMTRFHALTEIARYTTGGKYGIGFDLTLRDATTGAVLAGPRHVATGFPASGGQKAVEEEARGRSEKVVITENLEGLIRAELTRPLAPSRPLLSAAD